jgi:hypothetical protein
LVPYVGESVSLIRRLIALIRGFITKHTYQVSTVTGQVTLRP